MILDGATLIDIPLWERLGSNGQLALDRIAERCAADTQCAKAFPTWRADLAKLLARLDAKPLKETVGGNPVRMDGTGAAETIQSMSQTAARAVEIPYVVARAARGDYLPLAQAATQGSFASAPPTAIMPSRRCAASRGPAAVRRRRRSRRPSAGS